MQHESSHTILVELQRCLFQMPSKNDKQLYDKWQSLNRNKNRKLTQITGLTASATLAAAL